jgi:hypothetical protein
MGGNGGQTSNSTDPPQVQEAYRQSLAGHAAGEEVAGKMIIDGTFFGIQIASSSYEYLLREDSCRYISGFST